MVLKVGDLERGSVEDVFVVDGLAKKSPPYRTPHMLSWRFPRFLLTTRIVPNSASFVAKRFISRTPIIMSSENGIGEAPTDEKVAPLGSEVKVHFIE